MKWIMYEFRCEECRHTFETLTKPGDVNQECPECGMNATRAPSTGARCDLMQRSLFMGGTGSSHDRLMRIKEKQRVRESKFQDNHGVEYDRTPGG
jgi:putative FmdB family regulatory protein